MKAMYLKPSMEVQQVESQFALLGISGPGGLTDTNQPGEGIDPQ